MGAELYRIAAHEDAVLDTTRIMVLRQSLGDQRCREVVEEVVFHLTDRLGPAADARSTPATPPRRRCSPSRLASLSEQVGLADFARVARDLGACLAAGDAIATAAVGGAADAARRGFAVLGHALRRSIGLVARAGAAARIAAARRLEGSAHAARSRARPPGGSAARRRARRASPAGSTARTTATRAWVAAMGFEAGARRGALPAGAGRRRSRAALVGWGTAEARARDRFHLAAAAAKLPAGRYALRAGGRRRSTPGSRRSAGCSPTTASTATARASRPRPSSSAPTGVDAARLARDRRGGGAGPGSDQHARPATWGRRRSRRPSWRSRARHGADGRGDPRAPRRSGRRTCR